MFLLIPYEGEKFSLSLSQPKLRAGFMHDIDPKCTRSFGSFTSYMLLHIFSYTSILIWCVLFVSQCRFNPGILALDPWVIPSYLLIEDLLLQKHTKALLLLLWFIYLLVFVLSCFRVKNAEVLCLGLVSVTVFMLVMPLFKATGGVLLQMAPPSIPSSALSKCLRQVLTLPSNMRDFCSFLL